MSKGSIVQVIGTVVDVEFPPDKLPNIYNALETDLDGDKLVLEVEQLVGNNWARCLALGSTDGLARGQEVIDTGAAVQVPVGDPSLGRLFKRLKYMAYHLLRINIKRHFRTNRLHSDLRSGLIFK